MREQFEKETGNSNGAKALPHEYARWLESRCDECPKYSKSEYRKLEAENTRLREGCKTALRIAEVWIPKMIAEKYAGEQEALELMKEDLQALTEKEK